MVASRPSVLLPAGVVQLSRRVDQREVAECLRCVAELAVGVAIPFFTEQSDVIAHREEFLEEFRCCWPPAGVDQCVDEPERASQEDALGAG
jgi:hypothetical protein